MKNNKNITYYTLENETHKIVISDLGGIIHQFIIKNIGGEDIDIVLGHEHGEAYFENAGTLGAIVGRHANRIENANVIINDIKYDLEVNHFHNNLHTGKKGLQYKFFDGTEKGQSLILKTTQKHLEDGFPGNLDVTITYTLDHDTLHITYDAISDEDTIVNLTNHSYFNLNGHDKENVYNHNLYINSNYMMPNDKFSLVKKEIKSVHETAFDFSTKDNVKKHLLSSEEQVSSFNGIDHNFLLNTHISNHVVSMDNEKLQLDIYTDLPAMHVYTGNHFDEDITVGKHHKPYVLHGGIAFETQLSPNSMQMPWLRSPLVKKNEKYHTTTSFQLKKLES